MSRFSNLEFEGAGERAASRSVHERDDVRQLAEAWAAFENAEFERALQAFAKALEFNPHCVAPWFGQVRALIELEDFRGANLWADKAIERFPHDPELLAAKAVALGRMGQGDEALALSDAAIQSREETPYVWLARGDVLLSRREPRADYCFDKALLLAAKDWVMRWLAARVRAFHRQFAVALRLVQQSLELRPDHPVLWLLAGRCQRELGLNAAARASFEQALQIDARCSEARLSLTALAGAGLGSRLAGWWRRWFG